MISSYTNGPFERSPCEPHMSPWSDVNRIAVSSQAPDASPSRPAWTARWNGRVGLSLAGHDEVSLDSLVARTVALRG